MSPGALYVQIDDNMSEDTFLHCHTALGLIS